MAVTGVEVAGSCLSRVDTWSGARTESTVPPIESKYPNHYRFSIRIDIVPSIAIHARSNANLHAYLSIGIADKIPSKTPLLNSTAVYVGRFVVMFTYRTCVSLRKLAHVISFGIIQAHAISNLRFLTNLTLCAHNVTLEFRRVCIRNKHEID